MEYPGIVTYTKVYCQRIYECQHIAGIPWNIQGLSLILKYIVRDSMNVSIYSWHSMENPGIVTNTKVILWLEITTCIQKDSSSFF